MKPKFAAVLFDLDGTLIDTEEHIHGALNYALGKHGLPPLTKKQHASLAGTPLKVIYPRLAPNVDFEELLRDHREFQMNNLQLARKFEDAEQVVDELKKSKIKVAIVTARMRMTTKAIFKEIGWNEGMFDAVITPEDTPRQKPDPAPFLLCAEKLKVQPKDCLSVGDACNDIVGGKAAGMKTCRAVYGYGGKVACMKADYEIDSLEEILRVVLAR